MTKMVFLLATLLLICFGLICYWDFRWYVIPNSVNSMLLLGGLLAQVESGWIAVTSALAFASSAATGMWLLRYAHYRLTGRVGLGLGDVKLVGASAVWFSAWMFPLFLFFASSLALLFLAMKGFGRTALRTQKIPFGPFLAASLILTWTLERYFGSLIGPIP